MAMRTNMIVTPEMSMRNKIRISRSTAISVRQILLLWLNQCAQGCTSRTCTSSVCFLNDVLLLQKRDVQLESSRTLVCQGRQTWCGSFFTLHIGLNSAIGCILQCVSNNEFNDGDVRFAEQTADNPGQRTYRQGGKREGDPGHRSSGINRK